MLKSVLVSVGVLAAVCAVARAREVNVYTSRHYASDQAIYEAFTRQTGITINRKEGKPEELLQLITAQGDHSPGDVFITVDAGNIWKAAQAGVLAPLVSSVITSRVPANLRDPGGAWFGVAKRLRLIFVDKAIVQSLAIKTYDDLAAPRLKGMVCAQQSSNAYNLSLLAAMIATRGTASADAWVNGVVANFARSPQGGDTDQLFGIASGECKVALANHYYFVRLQREADPAKRALATKIQYVLPDQADAGVHTNITAAALLKSGPNKAEAMRFLEFLLSDEAQGYFANLTNEFPIVETVPLPAALAAFGAFKVSPIDASAYGAFQPDAQKTYDRAGWR